MSRYYISYLYISRHNAFGMCPVVPLLVEQLIRDNGVNIIEWVAGKEEKLHVGYEIFLLPRNFNVKCFNSMHIRNNYFTCEINFRYILNL